LSCAGACRPAVNHRQSDALLGIFDAIAPAASAALAALADGDSARFHDILAPTVPLSRHIFRAPTRFYKTGVVFMSWLNGHQAHFAMVGGQQSTRSIVHLAELFRLADAAGLLEQPELAVRRMKALLALHGIKREIPRGIGVGQSQDHLKATMLAGLPCRRNDARAALGRPLPLTAFPVWLCNKLVGNRERLAKHSSIIHQAG
jgi:hypothetical protein